MTKTEEQFGQRILDLAETADRRGIPTCTDFMNLNELNIFLNTTRKVQHVKWRLSGGYAKAERQLAAFIPDALYLYGSEENLRLPIACLKIEPLNLRFAETLSHRDYLGAVLNLGIDRGVTGDILTDGSHAYLFCLEKIAEFICAELVRIRHTSVLCTRYEGKIEEIPLHTEQIRGSVASLRLDALLALAFSESRKNMVRLIEDGMVFVNGKCVTSNGCQIRDMDLISARGKGRFQYKGLLSQTKKGRLFVEIEKYI